MSCGRATDPGKTRGNCVTRLAMATENDGEELMNEEITQEEMTQDEIQAFDLLWETLGPLFAGIVRRLGRDEGLRVCRAIKADEMKVTWLTQPGEAVCVISTKDSKTVHSFRLTSATRKKFHFHELPLGPEN
jgi:hypothetical protein